jgi:hypothetical protein
MAKKKSSEDNLRKMANSTRHDSVSQVHSVYGLDGRGRIEQARNKSKKANPSLKKK